MGAWGVGSGQCIEHAALGRPAVKESPAAGALTRPAPGLQSAPTEPTRGPHMYDFEACERVLAEAKAEFGPAALARLEAALRAAAGDGPAAEPPDPMQRPDELYVPGLK